MRQLVSLTLIILMSLYLRANLDAAGQGFTATCNNKEGLKLAEDSIVTAGHIVNMLQVDMSLG
jgi:hypothetical protein